MFPLQSLTDSGRPSEIAQARGVHLPGSQEEVAKRLVRSVINPAIDSPDQSEPITYRRLHQIMLDGASHSDVGGSYRHGGIRLVSTYLMQEFQASLGLPVVSCKPSFAMVQQGMHAHDSRYLIDKLGPQRPYSKGTRREITEGEVTHWDGSVTQSILIESRVKGVKQHTETIQHIYPRLKDDGVFMQFSQDQLGKEYKLTVRLADREKGERGKMVFESTPSGVFGRRSGSRRFMFFGKALSSAPTAEAIIARLEAGEKAFTLTVKLEKALPVFETTCANTKLCEALNETALTIQDKRGYVADMADPVEFERSAEDWTPEIRKAIMRFNFGTPNMPQSNADEIMRVCMVSAAAALHQLPGAADLCIRFTPKLIRISDNATRRAIGISLAESPGGAETTPERLKMIQHCAQTLAEGLSCLANMVAAKKVDPYSACNLVINPPPRCEEPSIYPKLVASLTVGVAAIIAKSTTTHLGDMTFDEQSLWSQLKDASANKSREAVLRRPGF